MSHDRKHDGSVQGRGRIKRNLKPTRDPDDLPPAAKLAAPPPSSQSDGKPTFPEPDPADLPADTVLARFHALGLRVNGTNPWQVICPVHADLNPSLSITETGEGVVLLHCWGGCQTDKILETIGLDYSDLYPSMFALQFGNRKPGGQKYVSGGSVRGGIVEPTAADIEQWEAMLEEWPATLRVLKELASHLKLPIKAIQSLGVGYNRAEDCWIVPERNDKGRVVGLVRRFRDGGKKVIKGGRRGLTAASYPQGFPDGPVYLAEGASDTAALVSVGVLACGRASAQGSRTERLWLTRMLRGFKHREVIVVGDRDPSGTGRVGAEALALHLTLTLKRGVRWGLPAVGYKDVREQVVAGAWDKGLHLVKEDAQ